MSETPGEQTRPADAAYAEFVRRRQAGEDLSLEDFCAEHPGLEGVLRVLHSVQEAPDHASGSASCEAWLRAGLDLESARGGVGPNPGPAVAGGRPPAPGDAVALPSGKGRYVVRRQMARGGMGVILEVWDEDLARPLAMKVMQLGGGSPGGPPEQMARFITEARITGQLFHPGVVPVHERGVDAEGRAYFTMPLVEGKDLHTVFELVREGREGWTRTRALEVLVRVCDTLAYAHSRGVIHRDLKPANVMVGRFGETYVMDWGLAKVVGRGAAGGAAHTEGDGGRGELPLDGLALPESPRLTLVGTVLGTPAYMPPEQASGRVEELDERSDIYAVGAILYTLLAGEPPYSARGARRSSREVLDAVVGGPPGPIHQREHGVPPELAAICDKAMARAKTARYTSMKEMAEDLRAYLENRVVRAYRTGALAELRKWVARNRGLAASLAAAAALAAAGLLGFILWQEAARDELTFERDEKGRALTRAEGLRLTAFSNAVLPTNPGQALLLALEGSKLAPGLLATNALLDALAATREERTLLGHESFIYTGCFSPDGQRVLTGSRDASLRIWDGASGELRHLLFGHRRAINSAVFSPDGRRVASASWDMTARIWDAMSGRPLRILSHPNVVNHVTFSADGRRVVTACWDGLARLWDVEKGSLLRLLGPHRSQVTHACFSSDGRRVIVGSCDHQASIWDLEARGSLLLNGHQGWVTSVGLSPDGSMALTASLDGTARVWDASTGVVVQELRGHQGAVLATRFSPDGRRIVTVSADGTARVWDTPDGLAWGETAVLRGHQDQVVSGEFSPDGRRVLTASQDRTARIWDALSGKELVALRGHWGIVTAAHFNPDGSRVVTGSWDRTARIWDASTEKELAASARPVDWGGSTAFSPDLTRVVVYNRGPTAEVREAQTGKVRATLEGHRGSINHAEFSRDGRRVVTASDDQTARIWDAATGKEMVALRGHRESVDFASFSADGAMVVTGARDWKARIWEAGEGKPLRKVSDHQGWVLAGAFSPDGKRLATAALFWVRLEECLSGGNALVLKHPVEVTAVAFSPDGQFLLTATVDNAAHLWDASTGRRLALLEGHEGKFTASAFSPDGKRFATIYEDRTARLWEAPGGRPLAVVRSGPGGFIAASFDVDGRTLRTVSMDGIERAWPLDPYPVALERRPRELTPYERERLEIGSVEERRDHRARLNKDWRRDALLALERTAGLPQAGYEVRAGLGSLRLHLLPDLVTCASVDAALSELDRAYMVRAGATWRFFRGKKEPAEGLEWTALEFDDGSWEQGPSGFGYADGDDATVLGDMQGSYTTFYIRHRFTVEDPARWQRLFLSVVADDGCIAYLNSVEVGRIRVDTIRRRAPFDAVASSSPPKPVEPERIWIEPGLLRRGDNVLALQGFARSRSSAAVSLIPVLAGETARDAARDDKLLSGFREVAGGPAATRLLYLEGRILQRQGNHPAAVDRFSRVLAMDGSSDLARCRLVECLRLWGQTEEAQANLKALQASTREVPVDDPRVLNAAAWRIVRDRNEELGAFHRAYLWARKAAGLRPLDARVLNTLGLAQYRLGLHQEALGTLLQSESLAPLQLGGCQPADVAFLALSYDRLGRPREAREALGRLRGMLAQESWRFDREASLFLREAEELIAP